VKTNFNHIRKLLRLCCIPTVSAFIFSAAAQTPHLSSYPPATAVIFLDFDGHTVEGTSWNWSLPLIECQPSGLDAAKITEVFNRVAEDFRPFNINVTTDSTYFLAAPADRRMRVIITTTSAWYGNAAGGVAFISSFTWGDDQPCFVFSASLGYNTKRISEAAAMITVIRRQMLLLFSWSTNNLKLPESSRKIPTRICSGSVCTKEPAFV
jgi:hypothetical protein